MGVTFYVREVEPFFFFILELKNRDTGENEYYQYYNYWVILCAIMIWVPTFMMIFAYSIIWCKLRKASKAFPYLSHQSRLARSRNKVIQMLYILIIIELICWGPWQFYTLLNFSIHQYSFDEPEVRINIRIHVSSF